MLSTSEINFKSFCIGNLGDFIQCISDCQSLLAWCLIWRQASELILRNTFWGEQLGKLLFLTKIVVMRVNVLQWINV